MKPVAIVTPWFGEDLKGGAEQLAWQVAHRLADRGHHIEVLTTCCRSFLDDWAKNHLSSKSNKKDGLTIRRFPVDGRDHTAFESVNRILLELQPAGFKKGVSPVSKAYSKIFVQENIHSSKLLKYLAKNKEKYGAYIFLPYLYGPILIGLPLVADRAFLQPCLHDESYAYLPEVENIFRKAKGLLFNSQGEARLAQKLYGPSIINKSIYIGAGVEINIGDKERVSQIGAFNLVNQNYILYLGRRDKTKNTDFLTAAYKNYHKQFANTKLNLVLAGPGNTSFDDQSKGVFDFGLVTEDEKSALIANCSVLCQPSQNESYSRVIMEAWLFGKPVVVHKECLATASTVQDARGGWIAGRESEWAETFRRLDSQKDLEAYGENGRRYAKEYADWDKVIDRYEKVLFQKPKTHKKVDVKKKLKAIHQLLPNLTYGDAISNYALVVRDRLRSKGYSSEIFVRYLDEEMESEGKVSDEAYINNEMGIIYHHSIGSELTSLAVRHSGPKCFIYHNITPAHFFESYKPDFAKILSQGRSDLERLAAKFPLAVGDSAYNAKELKQVGFKNHDVLPITVSPEKWNKTPDQKLMRWLQDGKTNLIFVGRIAPNKCQCDLARAFSHFLAMDPNSRLILVGERDKGGPYFYNLQKVIRELSLDHHVVIPGKVSNTQLQAFYQTAHLYWSMSEHEGFGIPLIESMWFDVPVLAFKSSAVPETLEKAGLMFTTKKDLRSLAALAKILVWDPELRAKVISAQRERRRAFLPETVWPKLDEIIRKMERQFR